MLSEDSKVTTGDIYLHKEHRELYVVLQNANVNSTEPGFEHSVVYSKLNSNKVFVRPFKEFKSRFSLVATSYTVLGILGKVVDAFGKLSKDYTEEQAEALAASEAILQYFDHEQWN